MSKSKKWQLQEAKNKFSQVAEQALQYGPQVVTKRGRDAVVILSIEEYERLLQQKEPMGTFLKRSPLAGSGLVLDREASVGRELDL